MSKPNTKGIRAGGRAGTHGDLVWFAEAVKTKSLKFWVRELCPWTKAGDRGAHQTSTIASANILDPTVSGHASHRRERPMEARFRPLCSSWLATVSLLAPSSVTPMRSQQSPDQDNCRRGRERERAAGRCNCAQRPVLNMMACRLGVPATVGRIFRRQRALPAMPAQLGFL
jgi:hypothetical protein